MRTVKLDSWLDYPKAIADIRDEFGTRVIDLAGGGRKMGRHTEIVFRGQSDSEWDLKTTLERTTSDRYSTTQYWQRADSVVNEVETLTSRKWNLPPYPDILKLPQDPLHADLQNWDYLVYLRHHGFPSPLLDWTRSPYIAAFFALEQSHKAECCAVFAFIEYPEGGKSMKEGDAMIRTIGPHITTHTRHFAQKAQYTIATQWSNDDNKHYFCSHHSVVPHPFNSQDVLIKIMIPRAGRITALRDLEDYNINSHTLFQSEESLIRSLGLRAFELDR